VAPHRSSSINDRAGTRASQTVTSVPHPTDGEPAATTTETTRNHMPPENAIRDNNLETTAQNGVTPRQPREQSDAHVRPPCLPTLATNDIVTAELGPSERSSHDDASREPRQLPTLTSRERDGRRPRPMHRGPQYVGPLPQRLSRRPARRGAPRGSPASRRLADSEPSRARPGATARPERSAQRQITWVFGEGRRQSEIMSDREDRLHGGATPQDVQVRHTGRS